MTRSAALIVALLLLAACAVPAPPDQRDPWNNRASLDRPPVRTVTPLG
jgi:hypothetical protein